MSRIKSEGAVRRKKIKSVVFDLETLPEPIRIYRVIPSFGDWPGRGYNAELSSILCCGYEILGEGRQRIIKGWDSPTWKKDRFDDAELCQRIYDVLSDADEIITQNGKGFDLPFLNTRLSKHGIPDLPPIPHVDIKAVAKSKRKHYSNALDSMAKFYEVSKKMDIQDKWEMWVRFAFGNDTKADRKLMADYCMHDVKATTALYEKLRPAVGSAGVNRNFWAVQNDITCPTCGSHALLSNGWRRTSTEEYKRLRCLDCGASSRLDKKGKKPRAV